MYYSIHWVLSFLEVFPTITTSFVYQLVVCLFGFCSLILTPLVLICHACIRLMYTSRSGFLSLPNIFVVLILCNNTPFLNTVPHSLAIVNIFSLWPLVFIVHVVFTVIPYFLSRGEDTVLSKPNSINHC